MIWDGLKAWARIRADSPDMPTVDECITCVHRISEEIAGRPNTLRADVVQFYADETREMICRFCEELLSDAAQDDQNEPGLEPAV